MKYLRSIRSTQSFKNNVAAGIIALMMSCSFCLANTMYAVDDVGMSDSRLVRLERTGDSFAVTEIGPIHSGADIEGIDFHPTSGVLYAVGGERGQATGKTFYSWDTTDGTLTDLGTIGGASNPFAGLDIIAATFRPTDSTFWICVEDSGLYEMNINTLDVTLRSDDAIFTTGAGAEGLTWTLDGQSLLAGADETIYEIDLTDGSATSLLTIGHEIEGLGYDDDGNLYAVKSEKITQIYNTGGSYSSELLTNSLSGNRDLESLASQIPEPATLSLLGLGVLAMLRQRRTRV